MYLVAVVSGDPIARGQRLAATRDLLRAAARCEDPKRRRGILLEVAALNADEALAVAAALCRRFRPTGMDERKVLSRALDSYLSAVLDTEPAAEPDLLVRVAPVLRAAVVRLTRESAGVPSRT
jgi:hypothetical protein